MAEPPHTKGQFCEDLGSSFTGSQDRITRAGRPKKSQDRVEPQGRLCAPAGRRTTSKATAGDSSSEDEINMLTGSSRHSSRSSIKEERKQRTKTEGGTVKDNPAHTIDAHMKDPRYKPTEEVIATLKFKKTKLAMDGLTSSTSTEAGNFRTRDTPPARVAGPPHVDSKSKRYVTDNDTTPQRIRSYVDPTKRHDPPRYNHSQTSRVSVVSNNGEGDKCDDARTPRPTRPAPRPAYKGAQKASSARPFPPISPLGSAKCKGKDADGHERTGISQNIPDGVSPLVSRKGSSSQGGSWANGVGKKIKRSNPISAISPLSSQPKVQSHRGCIATSLDPIGNMSPLSSKAKGKKKAGLKPQSFPTISPLSSPLQKNDSRTARRKPSGSSQKSSSGRSRARMVIISEEGSETTSDEDMQSTRSARRIRPFPMETQLLESIGQSPAKRSSPEESDGESRDRKKRREEPSPPLAELLLDDDASDIDDDDLLFLDPNIDPATLCPWCDEQLPPAPTPHLSALIAAARRRSSPDDRPTNPLGLRAPLGVFVGVCQRHRFENYQVPRAQRRGWPTQIAWEDVGARVEALQAQFEAIIEDVDEEFLPGATWKDDDEEDEADFEGRPRKGSVFWRDATRSVKKTGSRQTAGRVYGELGYVVIHQTIYNLFPPTSFDPDSTLPLTPTDFIQLILVPEAAVSLIMEDMSQTRAAAIRTLRDSAEYGVAMFPDDGADVTDAGEQIIMERARARRKELEEEERLEEKMLRDFQGEEAVRRKAKARPKPKKSAEMVTDSDDTMSSRRPRRNGKMNAQIVSDYRSGDDGTTSSTSDESGIGRGKRGRRPLDEDYKPPRHKEPRRIASSDVDVSERDGFARLPRETQKPPRPRPKARHKPASEVEEPADGAGSDSLEISEPAPSSSQSIPFVRWDDKGEAHVRMPRNVMDPDATPKKTSQSRSMSSTKSTIGAKLRAKTAQANQVSRLEAPKTARNLRTDTIRRDEFAWLLSDSSQPTP
ncbi:hypothetical protein A0H81_05976 [Grifola frondosa]|uniref:Restriction of telomere capping protein 4 n=1 Tax=Grifola frondosa TaxID=5627 RepID=A0A1C7M9Q8_GRIFR|nr:hypothetical protein A0H81_05976 [Grifola frondosa]